MKLIAGDVNRVEDDELTLPDEPVLYSMEKSSGPSFDEQSFADYHMYTLQHKTTLKNNQSKQINFIQAEEIPYKHYYSFNHYNEKPK
ncbi:hypothetical protein ACJROX_07660 [Pseudalkalibacillus sp. A8]|uniref:hypothetical protein n=1 Tax=Pseudalkalibacillus sp. A8 TaxID=3382641 RepID=UPI0038B489FE